MHYLDQTKNMSSIDPHICFKNREAFFQKELRWLEHICFFSCSVRDDALHQQLLHESLHNTSIFRMPVPVWHRRVSGKRMTRRNAMVLSISLGGFLRIGAGGSEGESLDFFLKFF